MTEPRPYTTYTENSRKFGHVVFEIREQTDRHTDTLIAILRNFYRARDEVKMHNINVY